VHFQPMTFTSAYSAPYGKASSNGMATVPLAFPTRMHRDRRGPGGTWLPIDNKSNELRGEFPAFTREDLRDALIGRSSKIRPNAVPSFDVLKDKPISTYEDAYRNVYLNCLLIETKAIKVLLARLRANSGNEPAVDVASTLHKPTKRGRTPEAKARAAEAIRQLFPSGIPEMKQVAFVEVVNKQLKDSGKGPVSSETIARLTGARSDDRKTAK